MYQAMQIYSTHVHVANSMPYIQYYLKAHQKYYMILQPASYASNYWILCTYDIHSAVNVNNIIYELA